LLENSTIGNNVGYRFKAYDPTIGSEVSGVYFVPANPVGNSFIGLSADDQTYQMTILHNGNVGIGTPSPDSTLQISSSSTFATTQSFSNTSTGGHEWSFSTTGSSNGNGPGQFFIYDMTLNKARMIFDTSGNVGIGKTPNPAYVLDVNGPIHGNGGIVFNDGTVQTTAWGPTTGANMISQQSNRVGIGFAFNFPGFTPAVGSTGVQLPSAPLQVDGDSLQGQLMLSDLAKTASVAGLGISKGTNNIEAGDSLGDFDIWTGTTSAGKINISTNGGNSIQAVILNNGNIGIGTTAPGANYKLDVAGQIHTSAGVIFPDGNLQTVAYTGTCSGGDYAESVDVAGDRSKYEPGDVLVIGADSGSDVAKSSEPYSTMVVGVYSTKPGVVGRRQTTDQKTSKTEVPMAMVGIVPTKVSAENGPIKRGDLLVTSSTVGYAMKGTDRSLLTGAVIGKALGSLDSGTGVIEVVVTLQ
jgi:hypothetical protein